VFPRYSSVCLKYAGFLRHVKRDIPRAEEFYKKAVDVNPNYSDAVGGYASFLYGMRRKLELVEGLYEQAVQVSSQSSQ
jgi:hypothetical protein